MYAASPQAQLHMLHVQDRVAHSPFASTDSITAFYRPRTNAHTQNSDCAKDTGVAQPAMPLGTPSHHVATAAAETRMHARAASLESSSAIVTPRSSMSHRRISLNNASHHAGGGSGYDELLLFGFTRETAASAFVLEPPAPAFADELPESSVISAASASASEASLTNQQESASRRAEEIVTEHDAYLGEANTRAIAGALDGSRDAARLPNWWNARSGNSDSGRASCEYTASGALRAKRRISDAGGSTWTRDTADGGDVVISVESQPNVLSEASAPWMISSDSYDEA